MADKELYRLLADNCFYAPQTYTMRFDNYSRGKPTNIVVNIHGFTRVCHCHTHDFFEMNYLYSGECTNIISGAEVRMRPGSAVIMSPGTVHSVSESDNFIMYNVLINPSYFQSVFSTTNSPSAFSAFVASQDGNNRYSHICYHGSHMNGLIDLMYAEQHRGKEDQSIMLEALATQLIISLNRASESITVSDTLTSSSTVASEVLEYIYANYRTVTLTSLAKEFDYSKEHLSRLIYKSTGVHFTDIVIGVKMNHVLEHMENPNLTINYISEICGFESVENFHRLFKKKFGVSPKKFREIHFTGELDI